MAVELSQWDQEALTFMKMTASDPKSLGFELKHDSPSAREWFLYFKAKGLRQKASYLGSRMRQKQSYMVPSEWPEQFDMAYKPQRWSEKAREPKSTTPYRDD